MIHLPKGLRFALPRPETNDPVEVARYLLLTRDLRLVPPPDPLALYGDPPLLNLGATDAEQAPDEVTIARIAEMASTFTEPPVLAIAVNTEDAEGVELPPSGPFGGPTYHINPLVARGKLWATRDPLYAKLFDHATLLRLMGSMAGDFARMMNGEKRDGSGGTDEPAGPPRAGTGADARD